MKKLFPILALLSIIFSCKKDNDSDPATPFSADSGGVYISNEGKFQAGNASVSYFNPLNNLVNPDAFKQVNNLPLGDICQSMSMINGKLYLVVNNSGKIEICDPYTMYSSGKITGLTSPRYIMQVNNSKAYVTDLSSKNISIINLDNNSISGTIAVAAGTDQMIIKNNFVYVTNMFSEYLYIIDATTDLLTDSIHVNIGGSSIVQDKNGKVWVICVGDYMTVNAELFRIDPISKNVEVNIGFPSGEYPSRLCLNPASDSLYYLNGGIFKMSIEDFNLPSSFISSPGFGFYGLGIDKTNNIIYASDPIDFIQKEKVYRYSAEGNAIDNFNAGIVPGDFLFLE